MRMLRRMEQQAPPPGLDALLRQHRSLEDRMRTLGGCVADVLEAGHALLAFAEQEDRAMAMLARLLEPAVIDELRVEHDEIAHDLELLAWIVATTPDSPDGSALAESLARRMHTHVSRDGRLFARALGLSSH